MTRTMHLRKQNISFSQRLFWSILSMIISLSVCIIAFQYNREKLFTKENLNVVLSNYNYQIFNHIQNTTDTDSTIHTFITQIPQKDLRVTIIDKTGKVIYDNSGKEDFDNHNNRQEIIKARLHHNGYDIRKSDTTGKKYFYSATNFNDTIVRTALQFNPYLVKTLAINKEFIYFSVIIILIFIFVLSRFTLSINRTIRKLKDFTGREEEGNENKEAYQFPNDELGDIAQNIIVLYNQSKKAKEDLGREREKIEKHFQYAKEGFAMFTADGKEILSNLLYIQYANVISDIPVRQVEDVLDIEELEPINDFLNKNIGKKKKKVLRHTNTIDKGGKIFLIECILFMDNSFEIAINDISRQEEESRIKKQLTQNIAHELKTPVSSIQGYLETILNTPNLPIDKQQFFLERCFSQSSRLTHLLNDISVLNRMEEATSMFELKEVDVVELIETIQEECSRQLEEKQITTHITLTDNILIKGSYSLLYSIFRNLFDNSIAYAGEKTTITLRCYREDSHFYYFSFGDNGVGIDQKHINRIFERFYRVDKGRSRKIGGTGLGLSIVKNGVLFHKGQITAKSSPGQGVTFLFTLKKHV